MGKGGKWLLGCGIGCGLLVVLVVAGVVTVGVTVRQAVGPLVVAGESQEELVERLGEPDSFVPAPDGAVPAEHMDTFLAIRDELAGPRAKIEAWFRELSVDDIKDEDSVLRTIRNALGKIREIVEPIGEYVEQRNRLLLDRELGLGEYVYIYSTAYYSYLGHDPGDAPEVPRSDDGERVVFQGTDSTFSAEKVRERYRRVTTLVLRNLAREVDAAGGDEAWISRLDQQALRLETTPGAVAWREGGLPEAIEASLAPYRERLEATWSPAVNPFEMPLGDREWINVEID